MLSIINYHLLQAVIYFSGRPALGCYLIQEPIIGRLCPFQPCFYFRSIQVRYHVSILPYSLHGCIYNPNIMFKGLFINPVVNIPDNLLDIGRQAVPFFQYLQ